MDNYYKELSYYDDLKETINAFGNSLKEKRAGCFHHRVEAILKIINDELTNTTLIQNKIFNHIKQSNFNDDIKGYLIHFVSQSFSVQTISDYEIPLSLVEVLQRNEEYDKAMLDGYKNINQVNTEYERQNKISTDPERFLKVFNDYQKELDKWFSVEHYKLRTDLYDKEDFLVQMECFNSFLKQYAEAIILICYNQLTGMFVEYNDPKQLLSSLEYYKQTVEEFDDEGKTAYAYQLGRAVCTHIDLFLDKLKLHFSLNVKEIELCNDVKKLQSEMKEIINDIEPLLKILPTNKLNISINKTDATQFEIGITKEQLLKDDNKLIEKVSISDVFKHFEVLTKSTNKDGVVYLTEKQLLHFVKHTFIENKPKQQDFNGILYSKKDVRSVFYRFYKKSTLHETKQTGLKQKYFDIMDKSFSGFNKTDFKEFNKTNNKVAT